MFNYLELSGTLGIDNILDFWFPKDEQGVPSLSSCNRLWYTKDNKVDQLIRESFSSDWQNAVNGVYPNYVKTPRGCLALVVLLDQFPRNMFRFNAGSFASDELALSVTNTAISNYFDKDLSLVERSMLYMPLMHSESLRVHENISIPKFKSLADESTDYEGAYKYEIMHANIIRKFGRYPHRNEILNRVSTVDEIEFLKQPGSSF